MIDRNFIISLLLAISLVIVYNLYYQSRYGDYLEEQRLAQIQKDLEEKKEGETGKPAESAAQQEAAPQEAAAVVAPERAPIAQAPGEDIRGEAEKTVTISNGVYDLAISNRGAAPVKIDMAGYTDAKNHSIDLWFDSAAFEAEQAETAKEEGESFKPVKAYPTLGLKFPRDEFSNIVNNALFAGGAEGVVVLKEGDEPYTVEYTLAEKSGVTIRKAYTFYPNKYHFDFEVTVISAPQWGNFDYSLIWFGLGDEESDFSSYYSYNGPVVKVNGERHADAPEDDDPVRKYSGEIEWAALAHRYFTVFGIPEKKKDLTVVSRYLNDTNSTLEWQLQSTEREESSKIRFFVGPKRHDLLKPYGMGIKSIINYGWFDVIAKPMYWCLSLFHNWTGNWGWAIILLTVLVKGLFFPLTHKGFKSMQKLQKLQPHMKRLQEAYKDDREKMNQELMALYKEHKVNPIGGCMPMILQIPIFFALYKVLLESIELKGAEFILWIKDLSLHDPYYVTPILMGVSMLGQQMMTPKTGDPMQRKMMMALPIVFTIMFLTFPSGLVIYWLVNNILTIGQQWIIYRDSK